MWGGGLSGLCDSGLVVLAFVFRGRFHIGLVGRVWRSGFCCRSRAFVDLREEGWGSLVVRFVVSVRREVCVL